MRIWAITAPAWYLADQFPDRMLKAFENADWPMRPIHVDRLEFLDAQKERLPMAPKLAGRVIASELNETLIRAANEGVEWVRIDVQVPL